MEVICVKMHINNNVKILPIDLYQHEYSKDKPKKTAKFIAKAIKAALSRYQLNEAQPDPDCSYDDNEYFHTLTSIITDGPYLKAKNDDGDPLIVDELNKQMYLSTIFTGWHHDLCHQLELVKKHNNKLHTDHCMFLKLISDCNDFITTPKWQAMLRSVQRDFGVIY